jgi:hypothetical protein
METCHQCQKKKPVHAREGEQPYCQNCFIRKNKIAKCPSCTRSRVLTNKFNDQLVCTDCYSDATREQCVGCCKLQRVHSRDINQKPLCKSCLRKVNDGMSYSDIVAGLEARKQASTPEHKKQVKAANHRKRMLHLDERIKNRLRSRLGQAVKEYVKSASTMDLTGCSLVDLKQHLESKFQPGMTWDNYGRGGWHIDHVVPCVSFNLADADQQKKCFHYTNLQPLWELDNLKKGSQCPTTAM